MASGVIKPWYELWLEVPSHQADDVGALLIDAGALGAVEQAAQNRPERSVVAASFATTSRPKDLVMVGQSTLGQLGLSTEECPMHVVFRQDADWTERWKDFFRPLKLGSCLWIVPSWEKSFLAPSGDRVLTLDPGMAFGTGQHPTTTLSIELMEEAIAIHRSMGPLGVLDVGTGSGILAMAAVCLGAQSSLGIDNDPEAVRSAGENVAANHLSNVVQISGLRLDQVNERFPVVVANILAPTLISLAHNLIACLLPAGSLIVSGLMKGEDREVVEALSSAARTSRRARLATVHECERADWVALSVALSNEPVRR
jgi:ribosomal protein L11 methyltransferase